MNYFAELFERGITHYEAQQGQRIIRDLERGDIERAGSRLLSFYEDLGIMRSLQLLKNLASQTEAWGSYHVLLLNFLGTPELFGVDIQPESFLDALIAAKPNDVEELAEATYNTITPVITAQLKREDAYFIDIEPLGDSFLAHLVPDILEIRDRRSREAKIRKVSEDALDISELFRSPHALRLLLTAGYGARITMDEVPQVDELLAQIDYPIRISGNIHSGESPFGSSTPSEVYRGLFASVSQRRKEYLVNLMYSVDWNEELQLDGVRYIGKVGHHFSAGPLINALDSKSSIVVAAGARGLGQLNVVSAKPLLDKLRERNEPEVKQAATIALARLGDGRTSTALKNIIANGTEEEKIEAAFALANLKTKKSGEMLREILMEMDLIELLRISAEIAYSGNVNIVPGVTRLLFPQFDNSPQLRLLTILQSRGVTGPVSGVGDVPKEDVLGKFRNMGIGSFGRLGANAVLPIAYILQALLLDKENLVDLVEAVPTNEEPHPAIAEAERIFRNMIQEKFRLYGRPANMDWSIEDMTKEMVRALGLTGSKEAIPLLKFFAESDNKELAKQAIEGLSEIDVPALDALMSLKKFPDPEIRREHVLHVGSIFDERAIGWLHEQTEDDEISIRITAAMSLLLQRSEKATEPLTAFIKKSDKATRLILGSGIARLNNPIHQPLLDLMQSFNDPDIDRAVRAGKMTKMTASDDEFWA